MADRPIDETQVCDALATLKDPETGRSITQLKQLHRVEIDQDQLLVTLGLTRWASPLWDEVRSEAVALLRNVFPDLQPVVEIEEHHRPAEKVGTTGLAAKSVIAVGSGKGGVGKSSVALLLAYGLSRAGCQVGLMDADLYGPSIPHLIGSDRRLEMVGQRIKPIEVDGIKVTSMGFLVPSGEAVIWRGPMLHAALTQFVNDTDWGELDYLIVDMPPGTGDVPLSLAQLLPSVGAVVVCTPQDVALLDAVKAIAMFGKVEMDVLGMVENMSFFRCTECDARHEIFGSGGTQRKAAELGVPLLGQLPLDMQLRILGDEGKMGDAFDDPQAATYLTDMCRGLVHSLAERHRRNPVKPQLPILGS